MKLFFLQDRKTTFLEASVDFLPKLVFLEGLRSGRKQLLEMFGPFLVGLSLSYSLFTEILEEHFLRLNL